MRATIEQTASVLDVDGVPCRAWRGRTGAGVEFIALIHRVAVDPADAAEFNRDLRSQLPPLAAHELERLQERPPLVVELRSVL